MKDSIPQCKLVINNQHSSQGRVVAQCVSHSYIYVPHNNLTKRLVKIYPVPHRKNSN